MAYGMPNGMSKQIAIRLTDQDLTALDAQSRSAATRAAPLRSRGGSSCSCAEERDHRSAEEYRRAYGERPEDRWVGEAGLRLGAEAILSGEEGSERADD